MELRTSRLHLGHQAVPDLLHRSHLPAGRPAPGHGRHQRRDGRPAGREHLQPVHQHLDRHPARCRGAATIRPRRRCPTARCWSCPATTRTRSSSGRRKSGAAAPGASCRIPRWPSASPYYPPMFVAPNGKVFIAGFALSRYLDVAGGHWGPIINRLVARRDMGSAVMYAPGKILYAGGGDSTQVPTAAAEKIDLDPVVSRLDHGRVDEVPAPPDERHAAGRRQRAGDRRHQRRRLQQSGGRGPRRRAVESRDRDLDHDGPREPDPDLSLDGAAAAQRPGALERQRRGRRDYRTPTASSRPRSTRRRTCSRPMAAPAPRPSITSAPATLHYNQAFTVETPNAASVSRGP